MPRRFYPLLLVLLSLLLSGCSTISYYGQAIKGQFQILSQRQPISGLIEDPATSKKLKQRLQTVVKMRAFASSELGLPDNGSYKSYVNLERSHVVWNVFAAPEFSLEPKQWCYPVAGCVNYRGYFAENSARSYASQLQLKGLDTEVAGVSAYSTLGWFSDPLLNTMLSRSDIQLAGTLFHELAHQQLYAKNDTLFNESFAVVVELEGVRRWLRDQKNEIQYRDYLRSMERKRSFIGLVQNTRTKLKRLYAQDSTEMEKRTAKEAILQQLKIDYRQLRKSWGNYRGYDGWFDRKLTNASLVPISSYYDYVPAFQSLLLRNQNNLTAFYQASRKLAGQTPADRKTALNQLLADQTPEAADRG
ncbi:MAG: aminopeptidase [Acidiferrobacterales bacterium]